MNQELRQSRWIREWIVFALCLGLGGHIALGLLLHSPDRWSVGTAGTYGVLFAGLLYVVIQLVRSMWRMFKSNRIQEEDL